MDLDCSLVDIRQVTDFLNLCDTSAGTKIRLYDLHSSLFQIILELPTGIHSLTCSYRNTCMFMNICEIISMRSGRLLKVHDPVSFCHVPHLRGRTLVCQAVVFKNDVTIRAQCVPDSLQPFFDHIQVICCEIRRLLKFIIRSPVFPKRCEINLDRVKPLIHRNPSCLCIIIGACAMLPACSPAHLELTCIGPQGASHFPAKKHPDRNTEFLASDIPHGKVKCADRSKYNRSSIVSPEASVIQLIPDLLIFQWVHTDQHGSHIPEHSKGRLIDSAIGKSYLAISIYALVSVDSDKERSPSVFYRFAVQQIYFSDSHVCPPPLEILNSSNLSILTMPSDLFR